MWGVAREVDYERQGLADKWVSSIAGSVHELLKANYGSSVLSSIGRMSNGEQVLARVVV